MNFHCLDCPNGKSPTNQQKSEGCNTSKGLHERHIAPPVDMPLIPSFKIVTSLMTCLARRELDHLISQLQLQYFSSRIRVDELFYMHIHTCWRVCRHNIAIRRVCKGKLQKHYMQSQQRTHPMSDHSLTTPVEISPFNQTDCTLKDFRAHWQMEISVALSHVELPIHRTLMLT